MLKKLFDLQNIEVAERAVLAEKKESKEYRQIRMLKADFTREKEKYLEIEKELASLQEQLALFPENIQKIEERIEQEQQAIYDGSVVNAKELAAREAQLTTLTDKLQEWQSLNALYQGEYAQKKIANEKNGKKLSEIYHSFQEAKAAYQKKQTVWKKKTRALASQKRKIMAIIPKADLSWFESAKARCDGTPVAMLSVEHVCSGCYTIVTPIVFKRTCLGQNTVCEKCCRTFFVEEIEEETLPQTQEKA